MVTIATWNVNSVKSRLGHVVEYLRGDEAPDILLLQEIKCVTEAFPYMEIEDIGYNVVAHGQKTYNGVAILSRFPIDDVTTILPGDDEDIQARYIEAVISLENEALRVASIYVPNGNNPDHPTFVYKMNFFDRLYSHIETLMSYEEKLILGGDYNVAPAPIDVYAPDQLDGTTCYHPKERAKFRALLSQGLTEAYRFCYPERQAFSWWDYRGGSFAQDKGMRIDHLLLSPEALESVEDCGIARDLRAKEKPSDHVPVWVRLKGSS